jgi:hypothetical protein
MALSLIELMDARVNPGAVQSRLHARFERVRVVAVKPDWQYQYCLIASDGSRRDRLIVLFGWHQGWRYRPWSPAKPLPFRLEEI